MAYYPGQRVKSTNPRRLTVPKILLLLCIASAIYFGITFFPSYWAYYKADTVMAEQTDKGWSKRRQDDDWADIRLKIRAEIREKLLAVLKIPTRDLYLDVSMEGRFIRVKARWTSIARWPLIGKQTRLKFTKSIEMKTR